VKENLLKNSLQKKSLLKKSLLKNTLLKKSLRKKSLQKMLRIPLKIPQNQTQTQRMNLKNHQEALTW
jgi:hypothetical protein